MTNYVPIFIFSSQQLKYFDWVGENKQITNYSGSFSFIICSGWLHAKKGVCVFFALILLNEGHRLLCVCCHAGFSKSVKMCFDLTPQTLVKTLVYCRVPSMVCLCHVFFSSMSVYFVLLSNLAKTSLVEKLPCLFSFKICFVVCIILWFINCSTGWCNV